VTLSAEDFISSNIVNSALPPTTLHPICSGVCYSSGARPILNIGRAATRSLRLDTHILDWLEEQNTRLRRF